MAPIIASLQALALMKQLGLQPRRTIRVAFWVNEENGSRGGEAYRAWVGGASPITWPRSKWMAARKPRAASAPASLPRPWNCCGRSPPYWGRSAQPEVVGGGGGEDIRPLMSGGVPGLSEATVGTHYFDWHHSEADTLDKVDLEDFRKNLAAMAVMGYVLADMPGRLAPTTQSR